MPVVQACQLPVTIAGKQSYSRIGYFGIRSFPFRIKKYPRPHVSVFKSERIRHISGFTLVPRTPLGTLTKEHVSRLPILNTAFTVKNWARSSYVTGLKKKSGFCVHTIPVSWRIKIKISILESWFPLRIRMLDSPDTCWRKPNPQRKKFRIQKYPDTSQWMEP